MIFARLIDAQIDASRWLSKERIRFQARQKATALIEAEEAKREAEQAEGGGKRRRMPLPG